MTCFVRFIRRQGEIFLISVPYYKCKVVLVKVEAGIVALPWPVPLMSGSQAHSFGEHASAY